MNDTNHTKTSFAGGTLTGLLANINSSDLIKTAIMTAIGAAVSFVVSHLLMKAQEWLKKSKR